MTINYNNKTKVEGENYLYRDEDSNAIINTNQNEFEMFKKRAKKKNENS